MAFRKFLLPTVRVKASSHLILKKFFSYIKVSTFFFVLNLHLYMPLLTSAIADKTKYGVYTIAEALKRSILRDQFYNLDF